MKTRHDGVHGRDNVSKHGNIIIQLSHEHSYRQSHQNGVCTITQARTCAEEEHVRVAFKREASSIFFSMEQV